MKKPKRIVLAKGYIDYYMCDEHGCLGIGVINNKGEEFVRISDNAIDKAHGTKGKLIWETTK